MYKCNWNFPCIYTYHCYTILLLGAFLERANGVLVALSETLQSYYNDLTPFILRVYQNTEPRRVVCACHRIAFYNSPRQIKILLRCYGEVARLLRVPWLFTLFKDECGLPWGLSLCVTGSFKWFLLRSSTHSQEWPKFWPPKKSTHQGMVQPNFVDTQSDNLLKRHWTYTLNM